MHRHLRSSGNSALGHIGGILIDRCGCDLWHHYDRHLVG
jgi:hypothetical protein